MPHIHEHYDFTISAFIVYDHKVLLVQHPRYGKWLPMGGHIELDEDIEDALYREIAEETGLTVKIISSKPDIDSPGTKFILTPSYVDVHEANPPHKHINFTYFAVAINNKAVLSDEHSAIAWLTEADLHSDRYDLSPSIRFYAQQALLVAAA